MLPPCGGHSLRGRLRCLFLLFLEPIGVHFAKKLQKNYGGLADDDDCDTCGGFSSAGR